MEITLKNDRQWVILSFEGRLDSFNFDLVSNKITTLIKMGKIFLVIDLSQITFINVPSLLFLKSTAEKLKNKNGCLGLLSPNESLIKRLQVFNRPKLISIFNEISDVHTICSPEVSQ